MDLKEVKQKEIKRSTGRLYLFVLLFLYMILSAPAIYFFQDTIARISTMIIWFIALLALAVASNIEAKIIRGLKKG